MALPTMARAFDRDTFLSWCHGVDDGPFSSISTGDRITFHNPDLMVTTAAAAALTERVRVMTNVVVLPLHASAMVAKQLATIDVLSNGRLTVGVGVGGREVDYRAVGTPFDQRHQRLDDAVARLRHLWSSAAPFEGADPVGPPPLQPGGPPLLAGALGPRAIGRAAAWAEGVTGFALSGTRAEIEGTNNLARQAWARAGRERPPRLVSGTFYVLGTPDPLEDLRRFAFEYLRVFGDRVASSLSSSLEVAAPERLRTVLEDAEAAGCDEFILVPGTVDLACLEATVDVLS